MELPTIRATIRRNYREFDMKYTSGDTMKWCRHYYIVYTIVTKNAQNSKLCVATEVKFGTFMRYKL